MKLLTEAGAIFDRLMGILMSAACVIFTVAMLLVCTEVNTRYALNRPIGWAIEVCEYILVGIVSLGMAWLLKEEGHVTVDFLLNQLKPRPQALLTGITSALGAAAVLIIVVFGFLETVHLMGTSARETGILRIDKAYLLFPLTTGTFLFFIQLVRRSYKHLRGLRTAEAKGLEP